MLWKNTLPRTCYDSVPLTEGATGSPFDIRIAADKQSARRRRRSAPNDEQSSDAHAARTLPDGGPGDSAPREYDNDFSVQTENCSSSSQQKTRGGRLEVQCHAPTRFCRVHL